ncbi:MAG: type Z 30S ribosomal protein S14 [Planctomycetota bacterium]
MARKALRIKSKSEPKFSTRGYSRCELCGRPRAYYRKFRICRICLRNLAHRGEIPGMRKASW